MRKKSQIKLGESVAVLMIFFILIVVGIIFWSRYSQLQIRDQQETDLLSKAITISQTATFLSELQCSTLEVIKFSCFDSYKIRSMESLVMENPNQNRSDYYFGIFGYANISIHSIYPGEQSWTVYDFSGGNVSGFVSTQVPVSILNPIYNSFSFGYLEVKVYTK